MSKDLVSIIIPTYRGSKYISRTINSVLAQTYDKIEIIVVDDNGIGTDEQRKTESIVRNLNGSIKYIPHRVNRNGAAARNTGIQYSTGKYVCFLDDDDLMLPCRVSSCVNKLINTDEFDAVFVDVICADEMLTPTKIIHIRKEGNCCKDVLLNQMFFATGSNLFFKRTAIDVIGYFDESFVRHQDIEYMIRFYRCFKSTFIPEILLVKSKNETNNIPNYEKLKMSKEMLINAFQNEINNMTMEEKICFFAIQDKQLKFSKNLSREKRNRTPREIINYLLYSYFVEKSWFKRINRIRKRMKSREICRFLDMNVLNFLSEYK